MPKNSKNSKNGPKGNSFELLSESNDDESITVETTSARGRPLKRTQPFEPNSTKATIPRPASAISSSDEWMQVRDLLTRVETALASAEQRAEKAEKRIEGLEELIRNELFPRIGTTPTANAPSPLSPPSSPPPPVAPGQIPGIGLDLSRVAIPEIKEGNAGTVRRRVNEALKEKGVTCLGVNSKGNRRYQLLFHGDDVDKVRRDDTWLRTHFDRGTLYGEQWYLLTLNLFLFNFGKRSFSTARSCAAQYFRLLYGRRTVDRGRGGNTERKAFRLPLIIWAPPRTRLPSILPDKEKRHRNN